MAEHVRQRQTDGGTSCAAESSAERQVEEIHRNHVDRPSTGQPGRRLAVLLPLSKNEILVIGTAVRGGVYPSCTGENDLVGKKEYLVVSAVGTMMLKYGSSLSKTNRSMSVVHGINSAVLRSTAMPYTSFRKGLPLPTSDRKFSPTHFSSFGLDRIAVSVGETMAGSGVGGRLCSSYRNASTLVLCKVSPQSVLMRKQRRSHTAAPCVPFASNTVCSTRGKEWWNVPAVSVGGLYVSAF